MTEENRAPFFERTDWLSFWATTGTMLGANLLTLAPDLTLEDSGVHATTSFYGGIGMPPGYPVWSVYSWLFTVLLPCSNIAWRVAVSSAVAGALACGLIALMVSRHGKTENQKALRLVCGWVAGLGFGFNGAFWERAVVVDVTPLSVLLFCLTLCCLMRWLYRPETRRYFFAACFVYGLALAQGQAMLAAAPGLLFLILFGDKTLGRDLLLVSSFIFLGGLVLKRTHYWTTLDSVPGYPNMLFSLYLLMGGILSVTALLMTMITSHLFTRWKMALIGTALFLMGLSAYLYLPIASMTNPPVNWGYPRTVEGFFHTLTRGQFEKMNPAGDWPGIWLVLRGYAQATENEFGWYYVVCALMGFCFFRRARPGKWLAGLVPVYLCTAVLLPVVLNGGRDRQTLGLLRVYFNYSYVILAVWAGQGLIALGSALTEGPVSSEATPICDAGVKKATLPGG